jgi:hypothetical protein
MTTSRATSSRHHPTYVRGKSAGITIALQSSPMASCMRSASGAHRRDDRRDRSQHRTHRNRADSGLRDRPSDDARALGCLQHMSRPPSGFCAASTTPRCRSRVESLGVFAASFEDMSMTSPTCRALGQVVLIYFAVGGCHLKLMCSFTDCGTRGAALIFTLSWAPSAEATSGLEIRPADYISQPVRHASGELQWAI